MFLPTRSDPSQREEKATLESAGGVVKTSIVGQVGLWKWSDIILLPRSDHSESEEKATLESESQRGIFLNLNS